MNREQLLEKLKNVEFCAIPSEYSMDFGLLYEYVMPEGAGSSVGTMISWPAYKMKNFDDDMGQVVKDKLVDNSLSLEDINGTEIGSFAEDIIGQYFDGTCSEGELSNLLSNMLNLPDTQSEYIYALFDSGMYLHIENKPVFFGAREELLEEFKKEYCLEVTPWDTMDDEELASWYNRLDDEFDSFPFYSME